MAKSKRQSKNFFRYFVDEYILFRRDFYFEFHVPPSTFKKRLNTLHFKEKTAWWHPARTIVPKLRKTSDTWDFELIAQKVSRRGKLNQSAKAVGRIYQENTVYILEGQLRLGGFSYWMNMAYLIGLSLCMIWTFSQSKAVLLSGSTPILITLFCFISFIILLWIRMYRDRNYLYKLIQEAAESTQ